MVEKIQRLLIMSEIYTKRIKNKLIKIEQAVEQLETLTQEQQIAAIMSIDETLDKLSMVNNEGYNKTITQFDEANAKIDEQLIEYDNKIQELYKQKTELYKDIYRGLMKDL